ncbi:linker for activation of T-cells family member 1 isoform 1-T1 [Synchiropus picturatus]
MDVSWSLIIMATVFLVSLVVTTTVCLNCRKRRPPESIAQVEQPDDIMSTEFPFISPADLSHTLPCRFSSLLVETLPRRGSLGATETDSNPSYVNVDPGSVSTRLDDPGCHTPDYILVCPDEEPLSRNPSQASMSSSGDGSTYVNVPPGNHDYVEVKPDDQGNEESEDDDDSEGNYVNQPMMQPSA